jgi:hypothetical protein
MYSGKVNWSVRYNVITLVVNHRSGMTDVSKEPVWAYAVYCKVM